MAARRRKKTEPPAAKSCPALLFHEDTRFNYEVTARTRRGGQVAALEALNLGGRGLLEVSRVFVSPRLRRCGVATRLYEMAARHAIQNNLRLASGRIRADESHAFWEKQVAKGRAKCVRRARQRDGLYKGGCVQFVLTMKGPIDSLAGRRRTR